MQTLGLGPVLGALLASGFYGIIKYLNYEEVNGDQDKSQDEEKILDMARKHQHTRTHKIAEHLKHPVHHAHRNQHHDTRSLPDRDRPSTSGALNPGPYVNHYEEYTNKDGPSEV